MNSKYSQNQKRESFFRVTGQSDGEPCLRIRNKACESLIGELEMVDTRRSHGDLLQPMTLSTDKMIKYASSLSELLELSQTQAP